MKFQYEPWIHRSVDPAAFWAVFFHRQVSLQILWTAALPRLATESKSSHALASRVALLDALLRGADDELLLSEAVRSAMDEFLGIQMVKTHRCESRDFADGILL